MFKLASFSCARNPSVRAGLYLPTSNSILDLDDKLVRSSLLLPSDPKSFDMNRLIEHVFSCEDPSQFSTSVKRFLKNNNNNIDSIAIPRTSTTIKSPVPLPRRNGLYSL